MAGNKNSIEKIVRGDLKQPTRRQESVCTTLGELAFPRRGV
jgi:hypothetical protein